MTDPRHVLVVGATGMLGHTVLRYFGADPRFRTSGTVRSAEAAALLPPALRTQLIAGIDVDDAPSLARAFDQARPDVVVNCVGVVKQLSSAGDPLTAIPINSLLPHRLSRLAAEHGARFIHVSTDCVFTGKRGAYTESDIPDAADLYGRSKLLGEVDEPHAITLRTSIIGPELRGAHGLVGWFLAQQGEARGFTRAVFSGLPTVELARVIRDFVLPRAQLHGLYHVSAEAINKHDLLALVARIYGKRITLIPDDKLVIDRSLDSTRFRQETGYSPAGWPDLVRAMHEFG
jgi:dTDP-4-dehydrorhamnose reductase